MKKQNRTLWIILGVIVLLAIWSVSNYNGLVRQKAAVDGAWGEVENQYQRRFDLIPNLEATVKGAANFEKDTFIGVTEARTKWLAASASGNRSDQIAAAQGFDSALARLLVTVENYPDLKATQNFSDLQIQIEGTENRVTVARGDYNQVVQAYNANVSIFPRVIFARIFGFKPESYFKATTGANQTPQVDFSE